MNPPAPTESSLHEAALAHLARYAASEAGLRRVVERRIERWARAEGAAAEEVARLKSIAAAIAARLAAAGAVDDSAYAAARARRMAQGGRSRRAIAADLAARGVAAATAAEVLPESEEAELAAAAAYLRRRRLGPFRAGAASRLKDLGALARAGFARDVAEKALDLDAEAAEALIRALRAG